MNLSTLQQQALTPFNTLYLDASPSRRPQHTHITKAYTHGDAMVYGVEHSHNQQDWLNYEVTHNLINSNKQTLLAYFSTFFNAICPLEVDTDKYLAYLDEVGVKGTAPLNTKLSIPNHRLKQMVVGAN
jgi:hypothetical protein